MQPIARDMTFQDPSSAQQVQVSPVPFVLLLALVPLAARQFLVQLLELAAVPVPQLWVQVLVLVAAQCFSEAQALALAVPFWRRPQHAAAMASGALAQSD